jgi:hypothetical protein
MLWTPLNGNAETQSKGAVVRKGSGINTVVLALADSETNYTSVVGSRKCDVPASQGGEIFPFLNGVQVLMLLEPEIGDDIYLSDVVAGSCTTSVTKALLGVCYEKVEESGVWYASLSPNVLIGGTGGAPAPSFATVYSVNFAELPNQSIAADSVIVDGKNCTASNRANASTFAVQNGSGLYLRCSNANSANDRGNRTGPCITWPITSLSSALASFNWSEIQVWFQAITVNVPSANYETMETGLETGSSPTNPADQTRTCILNQYVSTIGTPTHYQQGLLHVTVAGGNSQTGTIQVPPNTYDISMIRLLVDGSTFAYVGQSAGNAFPSADSLTFIGRGKILASAGAVVAGPSSLPFRAFFGVFSVNAAGNSDGLLKKMKILVK